VAPAVLNMFRTAGPWWIQKCLWRRG